MLTKLIDLKCISLVALFQLFTIIASSQLSDLHYLPPLKQESVNQAIQQQSVYLSTPETTAFTVYVYQGTNATAVASLSISKTAPAVYSLSNGDNNITLVTNSNTGTVLSNSGLRFEAPSGKKFYVNYRGRSTSQAASLVSKGRQAMGTNFKWGGAPIVANHISMSATLGIMATEDATTITVSGYNSNCQFRTPTGRGGNTANSFQIQLNAGQSYVVEAVKAQTTANIDGWLGASIQSDKNIVISNGMLNFGVNSASGSRDAGLDQPVPIDKLGKEYVFVRGYGGDSNEFVIIIGTQNNTEVYLNGSTSAYATIQNGDYLQIPGTFYGGTSVGENMLVTTSKDSYAYQVLSGASGIHTVSLNFVAPVNCLLPDYLDNIPDIADIVGISANGGLSIIASSTTPDANIQVTDDTGVIMLPSANAVSGTNWKTFFIPNLTGDVSVQSSGPISVGFIGYTGARGISGYFSGFDTVPIIELQVAGGGCLPAPVEVIDGYFDDYQWYDDGVLVPGATTASYTPTTAGDYYVRVTKGGCTYDSQPLSAYYCNSDIVLHKSATTSNVQAGDIFDFIITVESKGFNTVTNLSVNDVLPSEFSLLSANTSMGTWSAPNWDVGALVSGQKETLTLTVSVNSVTNTPYKNVSNIAFNTQDQTDSNITIDHPFTTVRIDNDNDDDLVVDVDDLDDDNDGVLDTDECNNTTTNFALGGTATLSSTLAGGSASNAIDGNTNGSWASGSVLHSNGSAKNDWFTIDLGSNQRIDEIQIWNRTDCCSSRLSYAYVLVSASPFPTNTNVDESLANANFIYQLDNTTNLSNITIPVGITGRYVRIQHSERKINAILNFSEIQVFGSIQCNSDADTIPDIYDLDSDGDNCSDANEAYYNQNADGGDGGEYGTGNPNVNVNGLVTAATYGSPNDGNGNLVYDFKEFGTAPNITVQPTNKKIRVGNNANVTLSHTNTNSFQWQLSTDNGATFNSINDGTAYSGTQTDTLTIFLPEIDKNGYQYRVVITSNNLVCGETISDVSVLTVGPKSVITNRRITARVRKL